MNRVQMVISGLGGQGILFLTRVIAEAAISDGWEVLVAETHGMSQRGGAVESHLKLGGFSGSLVRRGRADAVLVLAADRLDSARTFLRENGACFANMADPPAGVQACDAARFAQEMNHPRGENLVLLGFASAAAPDLFPRREAILDALERLSPPAVRDDNRRAFEKGS